MEDPHPHDLYFSWPDLVDDPNPEEIYLSWRDLVGKPDPEEIYFSWEDIMGDLYSKQDSHLQTPLSTNLASFKNGSYKSSADSDAGDSRWDDTESNLSLGLSSAASSCSTNTSKWAHETWNYTEEDQLPPYSVPPVDQCSVEIPSVTAIPPRPFSSLGIREAPIRRHRHENYFSQEKSVKGIREIREHVKLTMQNGAEKIRLEYGLWRTYHDQKQLESCHRNSLYGQIGTEDRDLEGGEFLLDGPRPSLPPGETGVLPNQKSPLKTRSISAITPQQPLSISFPSYPTDKLSTGSADTDLSLGDSSDNQSLDSEESDNDTSAGEDVCEELDPDVNSEKIVADALDPMRMALVDRVMEEFWVMFNQGWSSNFTQHAGNSSGTSRSSNAEDTSHDTDVQQPSRRKRQREDKDPGDQNGNRNSRPPEKRSSGGKDSEESIKFACPFRKHNPCKYNIYSHRTCALSHWDTIARLKEHLYRCHQIEIHCTRCWQTFKNQQQLDTHIRVASANICPLLPGHAPDGITPEQEKRLRSRKKSQPGQSDESRWTDIYKLLFPNEEVPLPYFEPVHDEAPLSPDSRNLANYEEYIRRELPLMVRSEIEDAVRREMQPYRDSLIGNLVGIIQDCQDRVFRAYREGLDAEEDVRLPPSIDADDPEPLQNHPDQRQNILKLQEESNFLDAVFNHPPPIQDTGGFLELFDMHNQTLSFPANNHVFSDSGYASEMLCNCPGPCSCFTTTISSSRDWCVSQGDNESEGTFPWQLGSESFDTSSGMG